MATKCLNKITSNLQQLSRDDLEKLFLMIEKILYPNATDNKAFTGDFRAKGFTISLACPHCSNTEVIRFGHSNKRQRYRCKNCRKTFGDYALYRRFAEAAMRKGGSLSPSAY